MYPCSKSQLIWRTSDFGTKFAQKNVNEKKIGKTNIKFELRIKQYTLVPNFSEFGEFQFLRPNLPKNTFRDLRISYFK